MFPSGKNPLTKVEVIPEPPPIDQKAEDRRLWIGNLDICLSEYQLLKLLEKHGRLEKFDMLYHRSGPLAGQPRGYAFVTYSKTEDAEKMKEIMDGKKVGSKVIVVRWAHNLNMEDTKEKQKVNLEIPALTGAKDAKNISRTTKIQAIEAKLKMMEKSSSSDFQLNGSSSEMNPLLKQPSTSKNRVTRSFNKSKNYHKPYSRR